MKDSIKPLTFDLLRELSDGHFHSGEMLAKKFGISRASVHNAVHDAAALDLNLFAVQGRGYQLPHSPDWLDAAKVRTVLAGSASTLSIEILDSATSSNSLLMQRATQGAPSGTVLAVEWQTAGRGRLGRTWFSALGDSLTFSLLWRFDCGIAGLSGLSLAVGVALIRALRRLGLNGVALKWPNDVLTKDGKLAGILVEAHGEMMGPSAVVIGIGINLRLPPSLPVELNQEMAALAQLAANLPDRNRIFGAILLELERMLQAFSVQGFTPLRDEWEAFHGWQNQRVRLSLPDGKQPIGVVRGVTMDGALRLDIDGEVRIFHSGEISVRLAQ